MADIVTPPPDIVTIIDKTAAFVARNGPEFETRIKNEQSSAKFSFLQANDPFYPYYRAKVVELGGAPASSAASGGDDGAEKAGISASAEVSAAPTAKSAKGCLLYTSPSPRDRTRSRMPSSA